MKRLVVYTSVEPCGVNGGQMSKLGELFKLAKLTTIAELAVTNGLRDESSSRISKRQTVSTAFSAIRAHVSLLLREPFISEYMIRTDHIQ
ncbi:hypothetical protein SAMN04487948_107135 [Halogranum amylolyticum]|uniref:Uncharacterized protein n=1 Tax=Halogranum amylolyticum TaxID=660520 RepID=A0A1H8TKL5_9EURY|nr:hypothetical protein SAMN04487948_107135 [Halogranum amylolyticum]